MKTSYGEQVSLTGQGPHSVTFEVREDKVTVLVDGKRTGAGIIPYTRGEDPYHRYFTVTGDKGISVRECVVAWQ